MSSKRAIPIIRRERASRSGTYRRSSSSSFRDDNSVGSHRSKGSSSSARSSPGTIRASLSEAKDHPLAFVSSSDEDDEDETARAGAGVGAGAGAVGRVGDSTIDEAVAGLPGFLDTPGCVEYHERTCDTQDAA